MLNTANSTQRHSLRGLFTFFFHSNILLKELIFRIGVALPQNVFKHSFGLVNQPSGLMWTNFNIVTTYIITKREEDEKGSKQKNKTDKTDDKTDKK